MDNNFAWDMGTELEKVILISTLTFLFCVAYNNLKLQQNCVGHPFGKNLVKLGKFF